MILSISGFRTFRRCQRQWYYKSCLASATAKDGRRQLAYRLGKLQSVSAWRGAIVDTVIGQTIVPALRKKSTVTKGQVRARAFAMFNKQLEIAKAHLLHDPTISPAKLGENFVALHCMEYGGVISEQEIAAARSEIEQAITNLFDMPEVSKRLHEASYLAAQRALCFAHSGETIRAVPDLIGFRSAGPPFIVDWKVHAFGLHDAWEQLAVYALALLRCTPHKDFPTGLGNWSPQDIELLEVQLLTKIVRRHSLDEDRISQIEHYIADSTNRIRLVMDGRTNLTVDAFDFTPAISPEVCQRCAYRSLCWKEAA